VCEISATRKIVNKLDKYTLAHKLTNGLDDDQIFGIKMNYWFSTKHIQRLTVWPFVVEITQWERQRDIEGAIPN
jgi:hypothetical protein